MANLMPRGLRSAAPRAATAGARTLFGLLAVVAVTAMSPGTARAVSTCNGNLNISYVAGPNFAIPGDVIRVQLELGTGSIQSGTQMSLNRVRFELDCTNTGPGVPCTDDGLVVEYEGDGTITTTCGVAWTTGHATSGAPNEVVFTPSVPVVIPASSPGFCNLEFDVKVLTMSNDATPSTVEESTGFTVASGDATCNNGLSSGSQQSASIPLCPNCDDGSDCSTDTCNQNTGECIHTPLPDSTPCGDIARQRHSAGVGFSATEISRRFLRSARNSRVKVKK